MKFWQALAFTETDQLVELAKICEDVGFHGAFVSDHVAIREKLESKYPYASDGSPPFVPETEFPESWAAISAMAAVTTRLQFTTSVYLPTLRHPLLVAKSVSTAAVLSKGRVALGAGVGWVREEHDDLGMDFSKRGRQLDETLAVLRELWGGGMVEHHGEIFDFDRLQMSPVPPGPIPIYLGGASPPAMRRAARYDGWLSAGNAPEDVPGIVEKLRGYRKDAGATGDYEIIMALSTAPSRDAFQLAEDQGVTALVNYPLFFSLGPGTSVDQKRAALEQFAETFIR